VFRSLLCAAFLLAPLAAGAEATGEIDWPRRVIKARGQGAPDLNAPSISVARLGAERAAKADALRNLLETLKGAQLTSGGSAGGLLQGEDALRMRTEGTLRGFRVVQPHYFSDGGVALDVEVEIDKLPPELGRLLQPPAAAAAPGTAPSGAAARSPSAPASGTRQHPGGFIVDASGSQAAPARAPRIVDEAGAEVFGPDVVNADTLQTQGQGGYAGFARTVDAARKDARLEGSATVVKARVAAPGGDVVVSDADAEKLRKGRQALAAGRVVFVVP
jgi:hypothetical protein